MRLSAPVVICRRVCEMCRRSWQAASGIWNESSPMSSRSTNRSKPSARQAMLTMLGVCREKNTCMTQCFKPEGCSVIILPPLQTVVVPPYSVSIKITVLCHAGESFVSLAPAPFKSQSVLTQLLYISKSSPLQRNSAAGFLLLGLFTADAAAIVDSIASHETIPIIFARKYIVA